MPVTQSEHDTERLLTETKRRKSAEARLREVRNALEESIARNKAILSTTVDGIIIINDKGIVQTYNTAAEKIFGYPAEEIINSSIIRLMPAPFSMEHDTYIGNYLSSGTGKIMGKRRELVAKRKDGTIIPIDLSISAASIGDKTFFTGIVRDITERKKAEAELRERTEALENSNRELEQFAYVASHDLQEPLRMITSYMSLLSRRYQGKLDHDADDFINYAIDGAQRMQQLINDLLAYSRVGTKGKPPEPTNVNTVVKRALKNLQMAIEDNGAQISCDEFPQIMADEIQLIQLFQNLIANAIKFHGDKPPRIEISVRKKRSFWQFSVKDNGIGMDPSYKERIFQIFQRLHTRRQYPGTGIGLAICKKIVERHGGTIWVDSEQNEGSTFFFTFPEVTKENADNA